MNAEVKIVLERAKDCLSDASFNLTHQRLLAAANRSYYCVFDCLTALLMAKGVSTKTHQGAHLKFNELYIKTGLMERKLSAQLLFVFDLRQSADYDFSYELSEQDAASALEFAEIFLAETLAYFSAIEAED